MKNIIVIGLAVCLFIMGASITRGQSPSLDYSISKFFTSTGGTRIIRVTAGSGCAWTATGGATWITITSGANGSGPGSVQYTVAANTGVQRTGTITVQGHVYAITQFRDNPDPYHYRGWQYQPLRRIV